MNSIERKLVDNTLEYNERLKNSNNELQLEIKALKNKIGNMQNAVDKLDSYRRQGANFIIWKNTPQEFPDTYNLCLCKCFDGTTGDETNAELVYKLLLYKVFQNRWCFINGVRYDGKVIEYAELPKL